MEPSTFDDLIGEMQTYVVDENPDTVISKYTILDAITELVRLRTENDCLKQTIEIIGRKRRERNLR